jgi:hypothetical protein
MANIYHAVYNHYQAGEILVIIDGDDEHVGREVFKRFNAAYHHGKIFSIYCNHIQSIKDIAIYIDISTINY